MGKLEMSDQLLNGDKSVFANKAFIHHNSSVEELSSKVIDSGRFVRKTYINVVYGGLHKCVHAA